MSGWKHPRKGAYRRISYLYDAAGNEIAVIRHVGVSFKAEVGGRFLSSWGSLDLAMRAVRRHLKGEAS